MAKNEEFKIKIINEEGILFSGFVQVLFVPTSQKEELAILPYHMPLISILGRGNIRIRTNNETKLFSTIKSGILYVENNEASVLTNT